MSNPNKSTITLSYRIQGAKGWKAKMLQEKERMATEYPTEEPEVGQDIAKSLK